MGTHEADRPPADSTARRRVDRARHPAGGAAQPAFDAIVLAGGSARRFAGADKVMLAVAGQPILSRVLSAVTGAQTTVVVGPARSLPDSAGRPIHWTREEPAGSGPLAALGAGLPFGSAPFVVVLAGDMPLLDPTVVAGLVAAGVRGEMDGAVLVDADGHRQPLAAAYRRDRLQRAMGAIGDLRDKPMRLLSSCLLLEPVADLQAALDCDTPDALARANDLAATTNAATTATNPATNAGTIKEGSPMLTDWAQQLSAALESTPGPTPAARSEPGSNELAVDGDLINLVLDLARDAAHAVDRPAAPLTTFLVGLAAGRRGGGRATVDQLATIARTLAADWERESREGGTNA